MYQERPSPPGLRGLVAAVWRHDVGCTPRHQRVLPDGCMDLIWMDGAVHVAGPDTGPYLATLNPGQVITGVRFRPGAAPALLGVPAGELRDRRVRLDELQPGGGRGGGWGGGTADRVATAADPADALLAVVTELGRRSAPDPALAGVVAQLRRGSGVAATAEALGWTERGLHRRCQAAFGYGPSVLRRILRFRSALRLAERGVPFAQAAARAGYADQAHLAREVRALSGASLGELVTPPSAQPPSGANRSTGKPSGSCTTA